MHAHERTYTLAHTCTNTHTNIRICMFVCMIYERSCIQCSWALQLKNIFKEPPDLLQLAYFRKRGSFDGCGVSTTNHWTKLQIFWAWKHAPESHGYYVVFFFDFVNMSTSVWYKQFKNVSMPLEARRSENCRCLGVGIYFVARFWIVVLRFVYRER